VQLNTFFFFFAHLNTNTTHSHLSRRQNIITKEVPQIFDAVFECTLEMINKDFEEFPEYRTNFFLLLQVRAGASEA